MPETKFKERTARPSDIPDMLALFERAKTVMRASGNMQQWGDGYPNGEVLRSDMRRKASHIAQTEDGVMAGTFAFIPGIEPTYLTIKKGHWLDKYSLYGTIHRIAAEPGTGGFAKWAIDWCWEHMPNIRIDTHRDNSIMHHILEREGFTRCGIIYLKDGSERIAYQKICDIERMVKDAHLVLPARLRSLAEEYGFSPKKVFLKRNRSNWGSCSSLGNVNLNVNLVRIPADLRDYVMLHELCHLRQLNHSKDFHDILEEVCKAHFGPSPDGSPIYKAKEKALKSYYPV